MDVERLQPRLQFRCERLGAEHAAATVQHPHLAVQRRVPVARLHPRRQHPVEQFRTRRGQQHRALLALDPAAGEHRHRLAHVVTATAEALFAEVVGHAAPRDRGQPRIDGLALSFDRPQHQHEAVAGQRAARQLA